MQQLVEGHNFGFSLLVTSNTALAGGSAWDVQGTSVTTGSLQASAQCLDNTP